MISIIVLSLLIAASAAILFHLFGESKLDPDSPTIAAMEAHAEAVEAKRRADQESKDETAPTEQAERREDASAAYMSESRAYLDKPESAAPIVEISEYEYREMLQEGGGNFVLPQWIANFFSSSDICHTLDSSDNVIIVAKLSDPKNAESGIVDISADCDMTTQTVALKLCFGEGAAAEAFGTKFYLFERGDLFELSRLVRQDDLRIDILTRASDYTLEYVRTMRTGLPPDVLTQLNGVLTKISA